MRTFWKLKSVQKVKGHFVKSPHNFLNFYPIVDFSSVINCQTYVDNIQPVSDGKIRKY